MKALTRTYFWEMVEVEEYRKGNSNSATAINLAMTKGL